ncbi:hypothetical protein PC121_g10083 [Phytophthora cactorum]|nr:hypothetical protein PC120_g7917 [Phytophthora cactorum]KAG3068804.1 hypothetical protein PC121_g10083 [Phytophthora cactorum]
MKQDRAAASEEDARRAPDTVDGSVVEGLQGETGGTKRKRYVHSEMNQEKTNELLQDMGIHVELAPTLPEPKPVERFQWDAESGQSATEEEQRKRYIAYIEENIGSVLTDEDLCVFGVEKESDILDVGLPGYNTNLVGRTDILILSALVKEDESNLDLLPEAKMLIDVKRESGEDSVCQTMSQLIALDVLTNEPVMALLTNLTDSWQFFWISEKMDPDQVTMKHAKISKPSEAFEIIRSLLSQSTANIEITLPCIQEPVKRRKLDRMLPAVNASAGVASCVERYNDITSVTGPDVEFARATANQIVRNIPAFRKYA